MKSSSTILAASLLAAVAQANPISSNFPAHQKNGIKWTACNITDATMPMECATIKVPLDYTDNKCNQTMDLELQRVKAKGKSRGSVLVNFGGPGFTGTEDLAVFGKVIHTYVLIHRIPHVTQLTCFTA